jgi:translocation and assembly module TamA
MTAAKLGGIARLGSLVLLLACCDKALAQGASASAADQPVEPVSPATSTPEASPNEGASAATDRAATRSGRGNYSTPAKWKVQIDAPDDLRELLQKYLDVCRFQDESAAPRQGLVLGLASGLTSSVAALTSSTPKASEQAGGTPSSGAGDTRPVEDKSITLGELRRLVAATPAQARQLIETEGYFAAKVQAQLNAGATPDDEAVVLVSVEPGPQTTVNSVVLRFQGDVDRRVEANEAAAVALVSKLQDSWPLQQSDVFTQAKWSSAKGSTLTAMRAQGYLSAAWSGTSARIDEQTNQVGLFLIADSGPLYHFGPITIEGLVRIKPEAVENLRSFGDGSPYSDKQLFDFQERLQKVGLFSSVSVTVDPDPSHAESAPVLVRLKEQSMQQSTFGVGYSANTGARISLEQVSRRVFDWDWQAKTVLELGSHQSSFKTDFTSHPLPGMRHNLFSAAVEHLEAAGATTHSQSLKVGRTRDEERIDRTFYVEWQRARVVGGDGTSTEASAVTGNVQWVRRKLDNVMSPTDGYALSIDAGLGQSYATDQSNGPFGRLLWRTLVYHPLPASWFFTGRLDLGRVQSAPGVGIPDTLLFRAGGDDSIRGYDYRSIGPTRDGVAVGARTLTTGSIEIARPIWAKRPAWLWAVFVDAGDAVDHLSDLQIKLGYGVGLRWRSPVGALRVDVAHGEESHKTRLHLSLGMAF